MTTQQSLTEFQGKRHPQEPTTKKSSHTSQTPGVEPNTEAFHKPPSDYPTPRISELAQSKHSIRLWVNNAEHTVAFAMIGGTPGMEPNHNPSKTSALKQFLQKWRDRPIVISGGGSNTPMGHGRSLCRLNHVEKADKEVHINTEEIYYEDGTVTKEERRRRIGPYQIGVPVTESDYVTLIAGLSAWEKDDVEYLNPNRAKKANRHCEIQKQFDALSPGDRLNIPVYETDLEVVSNQFDTHAVIPRGTLSSQTVAVRSIVVSNPRGGYYQLGLETAGKPDTIQSCYIGISNHHPPSPNTAFTRDNRFSADEVSVTPIPNPTDQMVVEPDEDVLDSSLPEPRLQTRISEIDGVGEKTEQKLRDYFERRVTVERLAYSVFGPGEPSTGTADDVLSVLEGLPQNESVISHLRSHELATRV
jgi:hypothetical protein